jgi:cation:H+ antiporter
LGKAADWLVKEVVALSERSGVPKIVIGATIVSLGTTTPETAVSVLAALHGDPSLALGNAVGSIICDTGLILGLACVISPLPLPAKIINRQGWLQVGAGLLLVAACFPWRSPRTVFLPGPDGGGTLSQLAGFAFLALLAGYLWLSARWAREDKGVAHLEELEVDVTTPVPLVIVKLVGAIALVVASSHVLIPAVEEMARRLRIPEEVIAASLVAFGTSLPELVTALAAVRRKHGDLAVGNVVGADILNVLFVSGAAASVTPQGLHASHYFFTVLFPAMLFILLVFRVGVYVSGDRLKRPFGVLLLLIYTVTTVISYTAAR